MRDRTARVTAEGDPSETVGTSTDREQARSAQTDDKEPGRLARRLCRPGCPFRTSALMSAQSGGCPMGPGAAVLEAGPGDRHPTKEAAQ